MDLPPITTSTPHASATVTTTIVKRRTFKLLMLNIVSGVLSTVLAVLGYLQTINLSGILSPDKALMFVIIVNVANIVIRQWFSPPETIQTTVEK